MRFSYDLYSLLTAAGGRSCLLVSFLIGQKHFSFAIVARSFACHLLWIGDRRWNFWSRYIKKSWFEFDNNGCHVVASSSVTYCAGSETVVKKLREKQTFITILLNINSLSFILPRRSRPMKALRHQCAASQIQRLPRSSCSSRYRRKPKP